MCCWSIVAQWQSLGTQFAVLTQNLNYGTSSLWPASCPAHLIITNGEIVSSQLLQLSTSISINGKTTVQNLVAPVHSMQVSSVVMMDWESAGLELLSVVELLAWRSTWTTVIAICTFGIVYTQSGVAIRMDVNYNPIGKWHQRLAIDPAFLR